MNREDIIRMAREAEWLHEYDSTTGFVAETAFKFAALVASAEREACANLCIELAPSNKTMTAYKVLHEASKAIQSRGQA